MSCPHHAKPPCRPSLTEEMILREDWLPGSMAGWRRYRIEYGFECSCPEGLVYLPPDNNALLAFERFLRKWCRV